MNPVAIGRCMALLQDARVPVEEYRAASEKRFEVLLNRAGKSAAEPGSCVYHRPFKRLCARGSFPSLSVPLSGRYATLMPTSPAIEPDACPVKRCFLSSQSAARVVHGSSIILGRLAASSLRRSTSLLRCTSAARTARSRERIQQLIVLAPLLSMSESSIANAMSAFDRSAPARAKSIRSSESHGPRGEVTTLRSTN